MGAAAGLAQTSPDIDAAFLAQQVRAEIVEVCAVLGDAKVHFLELLFYNLFDAFVDFDFCFIGRTF